MKLLELVRKYKPMTGYINVGIETSGQQKAHIFALKELMSKHNTYFTVAFQKGKNTEGIMRTSNDGNKFEYFMRVVPLFQTGKIWFARELLDTPDYKELETELTYVTHLGFGAKHDDALDIVSQLNELNIIIPMKNKALPNLSSNKELPKSYHEIWEAEIIDEPSSSIIF